MSVLKDNLFNIRLSDGELAKLDYIARVAKVKKSKLIRKWISSTEVDYDKGQFYTNCSNGDNSENYIKISK